VKTTIFGAACLGAALFSVCLNGHANAADTRSAAELAQNRDVLSLPVAELERRMAGGDLNAQAELGARYGRGDGVPQNIPKALELLRQAAEKKNPDASFYLGLSYLTGTGVPKNEPQAVLFFEPAAAQGNPAAQYWLGSMIAQGQGGIESNWDSAFAYFWHAADSGYPPAEFMVGYAFHMGLGTLRNPKAAAYWYRRTDSRMPNPSAQEGLLRLIQSGQVERQPSDPQPADSTADAAAKK